MKRKGDLHFRGLEWDRWVEFLRRKAKQIAWLKIERCVLVQSRQENGRVGYIYIPLPPRQEIGQITARPGASLLD